MPRISVVVATYQRPLDLAHCLSAIARQDGDFELEVCVVNDGGPPVAQIAEAFPSLDVRVLDLPTNVGQVEARNRGLATATGEYVALCDDDDRWLPTHLQRLLTTIQSANDGWVLAYSDAEIVRLDAGSASRLQVLERRVFAWTDATLLLRSYNPIVPSSVLYPRAVHEVLGPYDPAVSHYWDWDFFLRFASVGRIVRSPACEVLYAVQASGDNLSADPARMAEALAVLAEKHALGPLPTSNFYRMTDDQALRPHRAASTTVWDGDVGIWRDARLLSELGQRVAGQSDIGSHQRKVR